MAKSKEFTLTSGRLWPQTPSGNEIEISVLGATGELNAGKTLLALSIAPGLHPEGHAFSGQPRTLYLDLEKSGATYSGTGCKRIDVPAELAKAYGAQYTAEQAATWFNTLPTRLKSSQYDTIIVDPINDIESGEVDVVRSHPELYGYTKGQFDKSVPLLMAAMKGHWKKLLMQFSNVCQCFVFITHLRDEFRGNAPTGKREPRGKETLAELASLYLWLERLPDDKGNVPEIPSAIVLKQRLADTSIDKAGELVITALMPPRIPVATVNSIRQYIANPPDYAKLTAGERIVEKQFTEADMERLRLQRAQAETESANARANLVDKSAAMAQVRSSATARYQDQFGTAATAATTPAPPAEAGQVVVDPAVPAANAKDEGAHQEAAAVAKEVQEAKNPTATESSTSAAASSAPSAAASPSSPNGRIDRFKAALGAVGYPADGHIKKNVDLAVQLRGQARFSGLKEGEQDAILAWLDDLVECQARIVELGLSDEQVKKMLANANVVRPTHLIAPLAATLVARLRQACEQRAQAGKK